MTAFFEAPLSNKGEAPSEGMQLAYVCPLSFHQRVKISSHTKIPELTRF